MKCPEMGYEGDLQIAAKLRNLLRFFVGHLRVFGGFFAGGFCGAGYLRVRTGFSRGTSKYFINRTVSHHFRLKKN